MAIRFDFTGDNSNALEALSGIQRGVRETMSVVEQSGQAIDDLFSRIQKVATMSFVGVATKQVVDDVMKIRGEFQQLEVAFRTMLGSEERATQLMDQLVKTAATTPFDLKGVADGAKMLLAYGTAAEDVNEMLVRLGDVAAGMSIQLTDLVYLYGTTMVQGRMFTQDLRQFQGRGIPIAEELAKVLKVAANEIPDLVTAGKVTAEVFHQAFVNMTSEGSKFGGLMEAQSKTIVGQISNIEDAIDMMFNDLGKQSEGVINAGLGAVSYLVENWQKVGEAIGTAAVAIGSYKAVMVAMNAIHKAHIAYLVEAAAVSNAAAAAGNALTAAEAKQIAMERLLTAARQSLITVTKELVAATLMNPYVWAAAAITTLVVLTYKLATAEDAETIARRKANDEMQKFADGLDKQKNTIQGYIQTLQDASATEYDKAVAWEMLTKLAPTLTEKYDRQTLATMDLAQANRELNRQMNEETFEYVRTRVNELRKELEETKAAYLAVKDAVDAGVAVSGPTAATEADVKDAEIRLDSYVKRLVEMERIKKQIEEDNKPIEIRIQEAGDNAKAKEEIYGFYKKAADLAGMLKEAHDIAEGTISNTNIPNDYDRIADDVRSKYDALIADLQKEVDDLREKVAKSPADIRLQLALEEKQKALNDILNMKADWMATGATTIPLYFQIHYTEAKEASDQAGSFYQDLLNRGATTGKATKTAAQWKADAYDNWKKAEKALDDYYSKKDKVDEETFKKKVEELQSDIDEAKKQYQKYGGSTSKTKGGGKDDAKKRQDYLELIEKQRVEQERAVTDMQFSTSQAEIDAMKDGNAKTLAQLRLDYEKRKEEIVRGYQDLKQAKIDAAKRLWEADPGNKGKTFDASKVDTSYTVAETANYEAQLKANEKALEHSLEEQAKAHRQYLLDYIKEYGSIQDQKRAISEEYAQKIADEEDAIRKRTLEAERDSAISELGMKEFRQSIDWEAVFNDLERQSTDALETLKKRLRAALNAKDITAENAKTLAEKIREVEEAITRRENPYEAWMPGLRERVRLTERILEKEEEIRGLKTANETASARQESALKNFTDIIGIDPENFKQMFGDINDESLKTIESFYNIGTSSESVQYAFVGLQTSTEDLKKSQENLTQAQKDVKTRQEALDNFTKGGSIAQYFKDVTTGFDFAQWSGYISQNAQSMAEFTDKIGLAGTDFGDAVHGFADGVNGFNNAIQSLASGDVFGAVNGVIDGLAGFGKSLTAVFGINWSGGNEEEVAKKDEKLIHANENLQRSIDALKQSFDKYNGMSAIETSSEIVKEQAEYNRNVMERFMNDMGYHSAHHSNNYYWEGFSQSQISAMNALLSSKGYSDRVNGTDWTALTVLSPEAMNDIRTYLPDIWDFITSRGKYGWVYDSLNEYADQAGKIAEQEEALRENLSQLSKTSLHDSFVSDLMDMTKKAEDFGDDFKEILMKAVLNAQIGTLLDNDLEAWRTDMAKRMESNGGTLTDTDIEQLRADWDAIVGKGMEVRNQVSAITGYTQKEAEATNASIDIIKDAFKSLVADTSQDMEEWSRNLKNSIIDSLVETMIFGEEFQTWAEQWSKKFNDLWGSYQGGQVGKGEFDSRLAQLNGELDGMAASTAEKAKAIKESLGYAFGGDGALEEAFGDLRSMFLDTLTDIEGDAKEFRKRLNEIMVKDLINRQVLGQAFTINNGTFKDFQTYLDYWNEEYAEAVEYGDQERIDKLLDELVEAREITLQAAEELRDRLKSVAEDDTFKGMSDNWVSTLMDMSKTAEDWAEDIGSTMAKRIIEQMVVPTMIQPLLDNLQSVFNIAMESGVSVDVEGNKSYDWAKVLGNDSLKAALTDMKGSYGDIQDVVKSIMDALGLDTSAFRYSGFSGLRDTFLGTLSSIENDAVTFGSKIGKEMAEQMAQAYVEENYGEELSGLQRQWQEALETGNTAAMEGIRASIEALYATIGGDQTLQGLMDGFREEAEKPLSELRDTLIDTLLDIEADADTVGKRIGSTLMRQMLEQMLDDRYASRMDEIRDHWRQALEGVGGYTVESVTAEVEALNEEIGRDEAVRKLTDAYKELNMELEKSDDTFKSMGDSFTSMLLDMDAKASDIGSDIGQTLAKKVVGSLIVEKELQRYLDDIQKTYDEAIGKEGATIDSVLTAVLPKIEAAVEETERWKPVAEEIASMFAKIASTPLDDLRSTFRSSLMDMKSDTQDFTDDIANKLTEAFIDQFVLGDEFDAVLEEWKKRYTDIMGDKSLSVEQRTKALNDLKGIIADTRDGLAEEARAIHDLMGTSGQGDQEATMGAMAKAATYDQFETYLGIAVAQQMATEQGNVVLRNILTTLQAMGGIVSPGQNYQEEIFRRLGTTNEYLLDIKRSNRSILEAFTEKLDSIISKLQ